MKQYEKWIQQYLDGEITHETRQKLIRWLHKDTENVKKFIRETHFHQGLRSHFLTERNLQDVQNELKNSHSDEYPKEDDKKEYVPPVIKLPWYAQVKYAALLMVGILIATYFINEYQYSQTEDIIRARLKEFYGKVEIERGGKVIPAQKDMQLHNNDRIRTQSDASAVMEYTDEKTRVEISSDTNVRVREEEGQKLFDLDNGRVDLSVDKRSEGAGFRVTTPHAHVDVVGTIFSVDVSKTPYAPIS